ncbi:MAG TPA: hypothetical protein VEF04_09505 [Blastocatellia bacterium]|nr:hypothetical protein [Blastocatellia bacterium]
MASTRDEWKEISTIIGETIGEASMCWEPRPTGIFDSSLAQKCWDNAMVRLKPYLRCSESPSKKRLDVDGLENKLIGAHRWLVTIIEMIGLKGAGGCAKTALDFVREAQAIVRDARTDSNLQAEPETTDWLKVRENQLLERTKERDDCVARINELEAELKMHKASDDSSGKTLAEWKEWAQQLQAENSKLKSEVDRLRGDWLDMSMRVKTVKKIEQENAALKAEIANTHARISKVNEQLGAVFPSDKDNLPTGFPPAQGQFCTQSKRDLLDKIAGLQEHINKLAGMIRHMEKMKDDGQKMWEADQVKITALESKCQGYRDVLAKISLGHEYGCGTNEGCRCTCRAGIAFKALEDK